MKLFIAVIVFTFFITLLHGLTEENVEKLREHFQACVAESGVDNETILKARKGEFSREDTLQKYLYCMLRRIGGINTEGEVQLDVLRKKLLSTGDLNAEDADKLIASCRDMKGKDKYETSTMIYECYYKVSPTRFRF